MDNGSKSELAIHRMPQGGFVVVDAHPLFYSDEFSRGRMTEYHFASTSIDEALKFIRDKIKPIDPND